MDKKTKWDAVDGVFAQHCVTCGVSYRSQHYVVTLSFITILTTLRSLVK